MLSAAEGREQECHTEAQCGPWMMRLAGGELSSEFSPDRSCVLSLSPRLELEVWSVPKGPQNTAVQYQRWPNTRLLEANSMAATSIFQVRVSGDVPQGPHVGSLGWSFWGVVVEPSRIEAK